jgi:GGDEF domain-containing protein
MEIPAIELVNYPRFHEASGAAIELAAVVLGTNAIFLVHSGPDRVTALNTVDDDGLRLAQGEIVDPSSALAQAINQKIQSVEAGSKPSDDGTSSHAGNFISCPVRLADGRLFGFIGARSPKSGGFSSSQREQLASVARLLGFAIDAEMGSRYDKLTGVYSRSIFDDHLALEIARSRRNGVRLAVLVAGFTVPAESPIDTSVWWMPRIAERLRTSVREGDTISRVGEREFALLVPDLRDNESAKRVAGALVDALLDPFDVQQQLVSITPAVGVAILPLDGFDPETLVESAVKAMNAARTSGASGFRLSSDDPRLRLVVG